MKWLSGGKQHYLLVEQFDKLGGVDGAISKIEQKLKEDATNSKGWIILAKLYMAKKDETKAILALQKARDLEPNNQQIKGYLEALEGRSS